MSFEGLAQKQQLLNSFDNRLLEESYKYSNGEKVFSLFVGLNIVLIIFFIVVSSAIYIAGREFPFRKITTNFHLIFYIFSYFVFAANALRHRLRMKSSFNEMKKISNELSCAKYKITPGIYGSKKMRIVQESDDAPKIDFTACRWNDFSAYYQHLPCSGSED